jgi:hypothetical protein
MTSPTELKLSIEEGMALASRVKNWRLVKETEIARYWEADIEGLGTIRRTEYLESEALLNYTAEMRKETANERYTSGLGSDKGGNMPMVHTATIPDTVYHRDVAPKLAAGDKDYLRWFLNQPENAPYRVREGNLRK